MWLNDTINGTEGTFVPLANPAVNVDHMYILAAFRPLENQHSKHEDSSIKRDQSFDSLSTPIRLYRIDIRSTIDERLKIMWHYDLLLNGTIPYLGSNDTVCTLAQEHPNEMQQSVSHLKSKRLSSMQRKGPKKRGAGEDARFNVKVPVSSILAEGTVVIAAVNFITNSSPVDMQSLLVGVDDRVFSYEVSYVNYSSEIVTSLGWFDPLMSRKADTGLYTKRPSSSQQQRAAIQGKTFWLARLNALKKKSYLEERELWFAGKVVRWISLDTVLQLQGLVATTELTVLQTGRRGSAGSAVFGRDGSRAMENLNVSTVLIMGLRSSSTETHSKDPKFHSKDPYLVSAAEAQSFIVALNITNDNIKLLWQLPLSATAVGQITTVDTARNSQVVITTTLAVYVYSLNNY